MLGQVARLCRQHDISTLLWLLMAVFGLSMESVYGYRIGLCP